MIVSFRHKGLERLYRSGSARGVQAEHRAKLRRILAALDAATSAQDLNHPGYRLHPLKGKMRNHFSIWVSGNWRVTFRFIVLVPMWSWWIIRIITRGGIYA
jgi:proteic killer suppression protein